MYALFWKGCLKYLICELTYFVSCFYFINVKIFINVPPQNKLSHYLSSKGLLPLFQLLPWGLACNPTLNILLLVVKLNLWNS
jgi:hypothetical protein